MRGVASTAGRRGGAARPGHVGEQRAGRHGSAGEWGSSTARASSEQRAGRRDRPAMRGGASAATALQTAAEGGRGWRSRRGLPGDAAEAGQQADKIPRRYEAGKSRLKPTTEPMKPKPRSSVSHFLCNRSVVTFSKTEVFPDRITKPNYRFNRMPSLTRPSATLRCGGAQFARSDASSREA